MPSIASLAPWPEAWEEAVAVASGATLVELGGLGAATLTSTLAGGLDLEPLETTREKLSVAGPTGAVKVGLAAVVLESVTGVPAVWAHL